MLLFNIYYFLAYYQINKYFIAEGAGLVPLVCGRGRYSLCPEVNV